MAMIGLWREVSMLGWSGGLLLMLVYLLSKLLYNVYFHPLSRFPGPKLWAASRLPFVLAMWRGSLVHRVQAFHEIYGSVVRLAPNEVSFSDPQACRDIYGYRSGHRPFPKNQVWVPTPPKNGDKAPSILSADDEDHTRIRRAWAYGFSDKALKNQEPLIARHVDELISKLSQQISDNGKSAVVDLTKWYNFCVFDIIGDLTFGESFGCLEGNEYHPWVATIIHHFKAATLMSACRYYPWFYRLLIWSVPKESRQKQQKHFQLARDKVQRRLNTVQDRPDFLSHLTKAREGLTDSEIEATAGIIIIAGSNSLTTALTGTTNYLLRSTDSLITLTREIRRSFKTEADINLSSLSKLPYLNAVIEEGLRIISPVPLGMPRIVPKGGETVCGELLPEDTNFSFMQWGSSLSTSNFTQPKDFRPERWLQSAKEPSSSFASDKQDALQPFSIGPRSCLGRQLAYFELRLILARMLFKFDISLPDGPGTGLIWTSQKTYVTWVKEPLLVQLRRAREDD